MSATQVLTVEAAEQETYRESLKQVSDEEPLSFTLHNGYEYIHLRIGETLHKGRYEIVRQLGYGATSSVWLAKVTQQFRASVLKPGTIVAIKVLTANATASILLDISQEWVVWKKVLAGRDHPGYKYCISHIEVFPEEREHGYHICMVTNPMGQSLYDLRNLMPSGSFPLQATKRMIKQILLALDLLHRVCRVAHTDIKQSNILVKLRNADEEIEKYMRLHPAKTYPCRSEPASLPRSLFTTRPQPLPAFGTDSTLKNIEVCIVDYGEATLMDDRKDECPEEVQPVLLRAPEVILGYRWTEKIDIWSVGCLTFELLNGSPLFQLYQSDTVSFTDCHLQRMVEYLDRFPLEFLEQCKHRQEFFDSTGSLLRTKRMQPQKMESRLHHTSGLCEKSIPSIASFIKRCLTIDPAKRPSAQDLLADEWLREVQV